MNVRAIVYKCLDDCQIKVSDSYKIENLILELIAEHNSQTQNLSYDLYKTRAELANLYTIFHRLGIAIDFRDKETIDMGYGEYYEQDSYIELTFKRANGDILGGYRMDDAEDSKWNNDDRERISDFLRM